MNWRNVRCRCSFGLGCGLFLGFGMRGVFFAVDAVFVIVMFDCTAQLPSPLISVRFDACHRIISLE